MASEWRDCLRVGLSTYSDLNFLFISGIMARTGWCPPGSFGFFVSNIYAGNVDVADKEITHLTMRSRLGRLWDSVKVLFAKLSPGTAWKVRMEDE